MAVAGEFAVPGRVLEVRIYGRGNVNDTFLVTLASPGERHFILQRLNTRVFRRPELVMGNLRTVSEHVQERLADVPPGSGRRWEMPRVLLTRDGRDHVLDPEGSFWRALSFIDHTRTVDIIENTPYRTAITPAAIASHSQLLASIGILPPTY